MQAKGIPDLTKAVSAVTSAAAGYADIAQRVVKLPGIDDWSASPSEKHPRPIVLVHGTYGNADNYWVVTAPMLVAAGYLVYRLDYGALPGVPVMHGLGPIKESAQELSSFVDRVLRSTGAKQVDIVGHSQGGMMPRYYLRFLGGAKKVCQHIALSPSNHGTTGPGMTTLARQFTGGIELMEKLNLPGCAEQIEGTAFLAELNEGHETEPEVLYTVIATKYDEVVLPYQSCFLAQAPNVRNILLQDLYPTDMSEHGLIFSDPLVIREVIKILDSVGPDGQPVAAAAASETR